MTGNIETVCFHSAGGREMIFASNRDAEWIHHTTDIRTCFGKLFDKESGTSILLLSPMKTGMCIVVCKMIQNRFGDNLSAYLHVPFGLDVPGSHLKGIIFDVISALEHNRRDTVISCLSSISKEYFNVIPDSPKFNELGDDYAYKKVISNNTGDQINSLDNILNNLFQEYYSKYKYIFLSIDEQHISNPEQYADLSNSPIVNWRPKPESELKSEDVENVSTNVPSTGTTPEIKEETNSVPLEYTSEWLKSHTEIHGWLSFFFFAIILGGLISAIYPIATFKSEDYAGNFCLGAVDIITGLSLFGVAIYTVYSFINRKPNAVFWGRTYVILVFLTNLLSLIGGAEEGTGLQSTTQVVRGLIWGGVWFLYLAFSEQVQEIIPKSFRKISKLDWGMLAVIILLPVLLYCIGYSQITSLVDSRSTQETELKSKALSYNERTDGKVIFAIPDGFTCESNDVNSEGVDFTVYTISNDEIGSCTLCSDYDTDKSESNFNSYWNSWKDQDINNYSIDNVDRGTIKVNGNDCLYRITKHFVNGVYVYWRYYLLFDDETGKVFLASFYDTNNSTSYVNELLESVKFK